MHCIVMIRETYVHMQASEESDEYILTELINPIMMTTAHVMQ